jgi:ketosteroid isomerase-like protein
MSRENAELIRTYYSVLAEKGVEAVLGIIDPEFESTTPSSLASEPDTYRGREGIRRWFAAFGEAMDGVYLEGAEFTAVGDKVLVDTRLHARGRATGIETEQRAFLVWTLREGLVTGLETFPDRERAAAAAGVQD